MSSQSRSHGSTTPAHGSSWSGSPPTLNESPASLAARAAGAELTRLLRATDDLVGEVAAGRLRPADLRVMAQGYRLVARRLEDAADERTY
jgi:hypothetical protein